MCKHWGCFFSKKSQYMYSETCVLRPLWWETTCHIRPLFVGPGFTVPLSTSISKIWLYANQIINDYSLRFPDTLLFLPFLFVDHAHGSKTCPVLDVARHWLWALNTTFGYIKRNIDYRGQCTCCKAYTKLPHKVDLWVLKMK